MNIWEIITRAFLLGLSMGLTCMGYCGGILLPYLLSDKMSAGANRMKVIEFLGGRLAAYIAWGFVIGFTGTLFKTPFMNKVSAAAIIFSSVLLLAYGTIKNLSIFNFCRRFERSSVAGRFPFLLGAAVGLNICPPFLVGFSYLMNIGKVKESVIFFVVFFFGTAVYMLPFMFAHRFSGFDRIMRIARIATIISGIWFFVYGLSAFRAL